MGMNTPPSTPTDGDQTAPRSLYRPMKNRMIAGVAAELAEYLGIDVTVVRIGIAVLAVFGGAGIALYIAGWLLMPNEGEERSIAQRITRSKPVCSH